MNEESLSAIESPPMSYSVSHNPQRAGLVGRVFQAIGAVGKVRREYGTPITQNPRCRCHLLSHQLLLCVKHCISRLESVFKSLD